jgi:hypothetical protein
VPNVTPTLGRFRFHTLLPGAVSSRESSDTVFLVVTSLSNLNVERSQDLTMAAAVSERKGKA